MYVIKYNDGIYAGTYSDMDGTYLYPSSYFNMQKPKVFKSLKGAEKIKLFLEKMMMYIFLRLLNGLKMI